MIQEQFRREAQAWRKDYVRELIAIALAVAALFSLVIRSIASRSPDLFSDRPPWSISDASLGRKTRVETERPDRSAGRNRPVMVVGFTLADPASWSFALELHALCNEQRYFDLARFGQFLILHRTGAPTHLTTA